MKNTGKKVQEFQEITMVTLQSIEADMRKVYRSENKGEKGGIYISLDRTHKPNGDQDLKIAYYYMSETNNQPLYNAVPPFIRERISQNPDKIYVMFNGWDKLSAGYMIPKTTFPFSIPFFK